MLKKIKEKFNSAFARVAVAVSNVKAEGYVDSGVKILIAVVISALLLAGLYGLFNTVEMLQVAEGKLEAHEYLNALKAGELHESAAFAEQFAQYKARYAFPEEN